MTAGRALRFFLRSVYHAVKEVPEAGDAVYLRNLGLHVLLDLGRDRVALQHGLGSGFGIDLATAGVIDIRDALLGFAVHAHQFDNRIVQIQPAH